MQVFCKKHTPYVHMVNYNGNVWAHSGNVYMLPIEGIGTIGTVTKSGRVISDIFELATWSERPAHLRSAFLLDADGKASDIVCQFSDCMSTINIKKMSILD